MAVIERDSGGPVRIGVLGVGRIGRMHAGLLAQQVDGAALGAIFDVNAEAASAAAAAGCPSSSGAAPGHPRRGQALQVRPPAGAHR